MTDTAPAPAVPAPGPAGVRVRFCPSPTGTPHVGLIRTALFNWAHARHTGGTFVFRIEDTDAARDSEESYAQILEALRWLGLDWDEGIDVGGPHEPYRQSLRRDTYDDVVRRLLAAGHLYESYSTAEEIEARHEAAGRSRALGYDNFDRDLSEEQVATFREQGRQPTLRLRVPQDRDYSFDDLVRGRIEFKAGSFPDPVLVRANGDPLYTLVNPVDDALMGITHVLRGEDLLSSTARQIALYEALIDIGVATAVPRFGHLPYVMGEGNKKLSKRDPESNLFHHRDRGFTREGLLNYLALLGWGIAEDRDVFSLDEMVAAFDVADVNASPARFDVAKAEAINAQHLRMLAPEDFRERLVPYLQAAGVLPAEPGEEQRERLAAAAPLVQERMTLLGQAPGMLGFLFAADEDLVLEEDATGALRPEAADVLDAALAALEPLAEWTTAAIEAALRAAVVDGLGIKPKFAFGPVRTAVTGRRVSPPLFESMEILGRDSSLTRLRRLRATLG
ncbi:glutamate--tRNA ligase [Paenibacillus sp. TRM 82003]|uniref:glutamate--tRNA ligase n=1 Tax=Kineococcus sp. TRM81007 TaxID=2925831 RepID=UPI001F589FCC|nr:glutamate--tRNA ligase [Kineococcus sp. TRM81007]MCI2236969.1 glutamate--tRNA ligase [Kineococcus sp. TRM81007]MCI3927632.1 glutamate--tRNA ligase [Paenibacillus sp. TRM 82003]